MTSPRANVWHRLGILELKGAGGEAVDLARTLASHGVATLSPQVVDPAARRLETTASTGGQRPRRIAIRAHGSVRAAVEVAEDNSVLTVAERSRIMALCRRVLGLEVDLMPFYALVLGDPELSWAAAGAGRMLRAPTVFEDVVKTICTTNCSWSATVRMVTAIVESLGEAAADGSRGFPSPVAMAEAGESFYRDVARAGYRGAYLVALASGVAEGRLDLEALGDPAVSDTEVDERLLALPGVGPYAAAHIMLIALGRYRRLVLDSWTRPAYARLSGRAATDRAIERRFRRYGDYKGLAFWLYVTRDWLDG